MKQIKAVEISSFEQIAPLYFEHITTALESKVNMLCDTMKDEKYDIQSV